MALPKVHRLRHHRDFDVVYANGLRRHGHSMTVRGVNLDNLRQLPDRFSGRGKPAQKSKLKRQSAQQSINQPVEASVDSGAANFKAEEIQSPDFPGAGSARSELEPAKSRERQPTQIGISISQKISKRAVVRNRIKRRIRAALRCLLPKMAAGWMLVIVVRPAAVQCEYHQFLRELEQLLTEIEVIKKEVTDGHS